MNNLDEEYGKIAALIDWDRPDEFVKDLRKLAEKENALAMNLLAVLLGDIDKEGYRDEITRLYERSYALGCTEAAENLAIQKKQWQPKPS